MDFGLFGRLFVVHEKGVSLKFTIPSSSFADAANKIARNLPTKPTHPVMGYIKITVSNASVELVGFDTDTSTRITLPAEVGSEGTVLVSAKLLAGIAKGLPKTTLTVETSSSGGQLTLAAGTASFTLPLGADDGSYPELPAEPVVEGRLGGADFAEAIAQVSLANGKDDTVPMLTGIYMESCTEGQLRLVATDRYRISARDIPFGGTLTESLLVPWKVVADTTRGLEGVVAIGRTGNLFGFSGDSIAVTTRQVDAEFIKYQSLLDRFTDGTPVEVPVKPLADAIKRVGLVTPDNRRIEVAIKSGRIEVSATQDGSQGVEIVPIDYDGDGCDLRFNSQYLLDGLNSIRSEDVVLEFTAADKPIVLKPTGDQDFTYLLMPIKGD